MEVALRQVPFSSSSVKTSASPSPAVSTPEELPWVALVKSATAALALQGLLSCARSLSCSYVLVFAIRLHLFRVDMTSHSLLYLYLTLETRYVLYNTCWMKKWSAQERLWVFSSGLLDKVTCSAEEGSHGGRVRGLKKVLDGPAGWPSTADWVQRMSHPREALCQRQAEPCPHRIGRVRSDLTTCRASCAVCITYTFGSKISAN